MLTFPLQLQTRKESCAIMHGLETLRGGNAYLDKIAQEHKFKSFMTIDWTEFDQRLPRVITDIYFEFLESLIVINQGYQPTYEYPTYPDLTEKDLYLRMRNLLKFLHTWYNNMTFVTQDGYAYRRTQAGVPSGLLNTQYLDSFANIFLLVDALCEFGYTDQQIEEILFFVMGDDNTAMTHWTPGEMQLFVTQLEHYALTRYNMSTSATKCIVTHLRHKIQTLSYTCNFGRPFKDEIKLLAQLAFPERKPKRHVMTDRAIGISYASCASSNLVYNICKDTYSLFTPWKRNKEKEALKKHLPSMFTYMDENMNHLEFDHFPTKTQIEQCTTIHKGFLPNEPKWNYSHFINAPDHTNVKPKTMKDYRLEHNLSPPIPINLN